MIIARRSVRTLLFDLPCIRLLHLVTCLGEQKSEDPHKQQGYPESYGNYLNLLAPWVSEGRLLYVRSVIPIRAVDRVVIIIMAANYTNHDDEFDFDGEPACTGSKVVVVTTSRQDGSAPSRSPPSSTRRRQGGRTRSERLRMKQQDNISRQNRKQQRRRQQQQQVELHDHDVINWSSQEVSSRSSSSRSAEQSSKQEASSEQQKGNGIPK